MRQKKFIIALLVTLMLTCLSLGIGTLFQIPHTNSSSSAASSQTNIGLWCQGSGCFNGAFTMSDMDSFYNATFGTGNFNSLVMYTNEGSGYIWYGQSDTLFPKQVQELALDSEKYNGNIKLTFEVAMDYNYNGTQSNGCNPYLYVYNAQNYCNPEYTQLEQFLAQDARYPALYALGVNWERGQFGCDYSFGSCTWAHGESIYGNAYVNNSVNFYANMVQYWGKQFISTGAEPNGVTVNPGPGKNWNWFCGADSVNNYPNPNADVGTVGAGYWYAGCHGQKAIGGTNSNFVYLGVTDGMFQSYDEPAIYYESQISDGVKYPNVPAGTAVVVYNVTNGVAYGTPCTWTSYSDTHDVGQSSPGCAPSGQWNSNTINWWFRQQAAAYTQYPSSRQFVLMGIDYIVNQTGQNLIYRGVTSPYKYWNSAQFECSVKGAESAAGITTPSNVSIVTPLNCPSSSTTTQLTETSSSTSIVTTNSSATITSSTSTSSSTATTTASSSTLSGSGSTEVSTNASSYTIGSTVLWTASGLTPFTSDSARLALFFTNGTEIKVQPYDIQSSSSGTASGTFSVPQYSNLDYGFVKLEDQYSNTIALSNTFGIMYIDSSAYNTSSTSTSGTISTTSSSSTRSTISTSATSYSSTTSTSAGATTSNTSSSISTSSSSTNSSSSSSTTTHTNHSGGNSLTSNGGNSHKSTKASSQFSTTSSSVSSQLTATGGMNAILSPSNLLSTLSPSNNPPVAYSITIYEICLIGGFVILMQNFRKREPQVNPRSWRW